MCRHHELELRKPYVIRDEVMILISLTRKYYVSKLVYHQILIISPPELSFLIMVHAGMKRHL